jgi:hypothetical protein
VRVKIEGIDFPKQPKRVKNAIDFDGCRRPVSRRRRPQTKAIVDGYAEPSQQGARKAAEALSGRNTMVAMVPMFCQLTVKPVLPRRTLGFANIMVRTNEDQMIGIVKEELDRRDFPHSCRLAGTQRVEADDHNTIHAIEHGIERCYCAAVGDALDLDNGMTRLRFGLFRESLEIRLLNVVQEAGNALIDGTVIRQMFELRVKKPAQLENRWEAIVDDGERRAGFAWPAPGEVKKYLSTEHTYLDSTPIIDALFHRCGFGSTARFGGAYADGRIFAKRGATIALSTRK